MAPKKVCRSLAVEGETHAKLTKLRNRYAAVTGDPHVSWNAFLTVAADRALGAWIDREEKIRKQVGA